MIGSPYWMGQGNRARSPRSLFQTTPPTGNHQVPLLFPCWPPLKWLPV